MCSLTSSKLIILNEWLRSLLPELTFLITANLPHMWLFAIKIMAVCAWSSWIGLVVPKRISWVCKEKKRAQCIFDLISTWKQARGCRVINHCILLVRNLVWCCKVHCTFHPSAKQFIGPASSCRLELGGRPFEQPPLLDLLSHSSYLFYCTWNIADRSEVQRSGYYLKEQLEFLKKGTFSSYILSPTLYLLIHFSNWTIEMSE